MPGKPIRFVEFGGNWMQKEDHGTDRVDKVILLSKIKSKIYVLLFEQPVKYTKFTKTWLNSPTFLDTIPATIFLAWFYPLRLFFNIC